MNKYALTVIAMMMGISMSAQSSINIDSTWKLNGSINGVSFYHKIIQCSGADAAILAFRNTNPVAVRVTWQEELIIDDTVRSKDNPERTVFVNIGEMIQVGCARANIPFMLVPISNYSGNNKTINKYNYTNVSVQSN